MSLNDRHQTGYYKELAYLWVGSLADDWCYCVGVPSERVHVGLGTHVPDSCRGVTAGCEQHVDGGMERQRVHGRQMAVVVADHAIVLQVPAFHLPVLTTAEQVRVAGRNFQS